MRCSRGQGQCNNVVPYCSSSCGQKEIVMGPTQGWPSRCRDLGLEMGELDSLCMCPLGQVTAVETGEDLRDRMRSQDDRRNHLNS